MKISQIIFMFVAFLGIGHSQTYATEVDAVELREPFLKMKNLPEAKKKRVALTLDVCSGETDWRIFNGLIENKIPATLFVTKKWLDNNEKTVNLIKSHPDLFQIENHGAYHIPPIEKTGTVYGIQTAGSMKAVKSEVQEGAQAIIDRGFAKPTWYRGATAKYTPSSIKEIRKLGFRIAGFSLNGDEGTTLKKDAIVQRIQEAGDGDVIIAHMNQPKREAGEGVIEGILALKSKGYVFLKLQDHDIYLGDDGKVNL